jgi:prevent-host-death family protein
MEAMKQANVSQLKARLSGYLADVRAGETVTVKDRRTPIAQLVPYDDAVDDLHVVEAKDRMSKVKPVRLKRRADVIDILRESRDQR